jgi:ferrous-iron efflux pump FieF
VDAQHPIEVPEARQMRLMRSATYASISVAAVLVAAKLGASLLTDSVSLLSTLIDSLIDAGASLVNLLAVRHALQPADAEHRYGHGKAEALAGLAQAAFICGSAGFLVFEAVRRVIHPRDLANTEIGVAVMLFAIVLTAALVAYQSYVVRRTGSVAIRADSVHYQTDVLVNASVILALLLVRQFGWVYVDPVFALAIAAYILRSAWKIGATSYDMLMDHELPAEERVRITDIASTHKKVRGIHDLRTRSSGRRRFIEFHLEMDGDLSLWEAHSVAEEVLHALEMTYPEAEIIVHQDPWGVVERRQEIPDR